jgi:prepilin-type N-terminal cleavage/methylation domain-containing protein
MKDSMQRARSDSGFTLIEVLVAMTVLLIGVLGTVTVMVAAAHTNNADRQTDGATNLARDLLEAAHSINYDQLADTSVAAKLQQLPGLADSTGAGYDIRRGGVDYSVGVDVCVMDDPSDGGGTRAAATTTFCPESTAPGTADKVPDDYKKVTVTLTWRSGGGATRTVTQRGTVDNPGSANGPAVLSIAPRGYAAPFAVTNALTTSVTIDATTSSKPTAINWLLDGTLQTPSPTMNGSTGLSWTWQWNIGSVNTTVGGTPATGEVLDGDYVVSAEAFNQYGISGSGRQETITLNRRQPYKPRQVAGGRTNFGTVEIEWTANSERDVIGYEVYRAGSSTPVCPLATQQLDTLCVDQTPAATWPQLYTVYAYDKDPSGALRKGDASDQLRVDQTDQPPYAPTNLTATRNADGSATLTWKRPSPEDPDAGDSVAFYRVYRDGQSLGDRYARWFNPNSSVTWQDTATAGTTHTYWVTAVDQHYAESLYLGPVTA